MFKILNLNISKNHYFYFKKYQIIKTMFFLKFIYNKLSKMIQIYKN